MKAEKDKVVTFHYLLTDESGATIDSSRTHAWPLTVLLGHGQIIPGLEQALEGREPGDKFQVKVPPEQGYGERHEGLIQRVPKKYFLDPERLKPGDSTILGMKDGGQRQVVVVKAGMTVIDVDMNHPLAGKTLDFDIEILDVRDATPEEIEHGHVHGEGGHHH
jgi:FKBP-type peptidyl-prolyl cis-trans isomerase SlyD